MRQNSKNSPQWRSLLPQEVEKLETALRNEEVETNGKIFRIRTTNTLSEKTICQIVSYVAKIDSLVAPEWKGEIQNLWKQILNHKELSHLFFPKPQSKKCKEFEKNNVLRIVGILRENGVYHNHHNYTKIHRYLEGTDGDSNYRSAIGSGLRNREFLKIICCLIDSCKH